jgi:hypothetical protein
MEKKQIKSIKRNRLIRGVAAGVGTVFHVGGSITRYTILKDGMRVDMEAIHSDWSQVGEDLHYSLRKFKEDNPRVSKGVTNSH